MAESSAAGGLDVLGILHTVSRYLFPLLAVVITVLAFLYFLTEIRNRREKVRSLPGSGTVGELIVLSGSRDLDANTWFPVPREGILGSVRSCDLVIPCPGVHPKHLDFSWADGLGLLIRPFTGCEALVNGTPVTCRTDASTVPMTHGSVLQVGSAVLRLHLFAALDNTAPVQAETYMPAPAPENVSSPVPLQIPAPVSVPENRYIPSQAPLPVQDYSGIPLSGYQNPQGQPSANLNVPACSVSETELLENRQTPPGSRRSDRWKEDLGE